MTNFTMIPNEIISNKNISQGAFKLYCILNSYCYGNKDTCFPSQKTLAEQMKKCIRTIQRYLKELIENGIIKIKRRGSTSNLYQLFRNAAAKAKQCAENITEKFSNKKQKQKSKNTEVQYSPEQMGIMKKYEGHFFTPEELEYLLRNNKA